MGVCGVSRGFEIIHRGRGVCGTTYHNGFFCVCVCAWVGGGGSRRRRRVSYYFRRFSGLGSFSGFFGGEGAADARRAWAAHYGALPG